ncbi:MAG TPA: hypothetical protein PLP17_06400 [Oligoflexia bacterium]|nr:hypothetical protein [Oligoflexia bacterium]
MVQPKNEPKPVWPSLPGAVQSGPAYQPQPHVPALPRRLPPVELEFAQGPQRHSTLPVFSPPDNQALAPASPYGPALAPALQSNEEVQTDALSFMANAKPQLIELEELRRKNTECEAVAAPLRQKLTAGRMQAQPICLTETEAQAYWSARLQQEALAKPLESRERYAADCAPILRRIDQALRLAGRDPQQQRFLIFRQALDEERCLPSRRLITASKGELSQEQLDAVCELARSPLFRTELDPALERGILTCYLNRSGGALKALTDIFSSESFARLSDKERHNLLGIIAQTPSGPLVSLAALASKPLPLDRTTPRLLARDILGRETLLGYIDQANKMLSENKFAPGLEVPRLYDGTGSIADIPSQMIYGLDRVRETTQSNRGICGMACPYYFLALHYPAETARIGLGLLSADAVEDRLGPQSVRTAGGGVLHTVPDSLPNDDSMRTVFERTTHSALVDDANGSLVYSNRADQNQAPSVYHPQAPIGRGSGLTAGEIAGGTARLFGKHQILFVKDSDKAGRIQTYDTSGAPLAHETSGMGDPAVRMIEALRFYTAPGAQIREPRLLMAGLLWAQPQSPAPPADAGKHALHAVIIEEIAKDRFGVERVYFRNPWGANARETNGSELADPPRRVEDAGEAIYSMRLDEFQRRVRWSIAGLSEQEHSAEVTRHKLQNGARRNPSEMIGL